MSLVPAQTTEIRPLPLMVRSRHTRMAPESGKYSAHSNRPVTNSAISVPARVISTLGAFSSSRSAIPATCSGVLPFPNTTSGMPCRKAR